MNFIDNFMNSTESYDAAFTYCRSFRPQLPAEYNDRRKNELPIPALVVPIATNASNNNEQCENDDETVHENRPDESTSGTSNTTNNVLQFDDNDEDNVPDESLVNSESQIETNRNDNDVPNSDGVHIESITNYEPQIESDSDGNGDVTGLSNQTFNENGDNEPSQPNATDFDFDEIIDSRSEQNEQAGMSLTDSDNSSTENAVINSRPDIKNELEVVQMDAVDELAISSIFNSNETASGISNLVLEDCETAEEKNGKIMVTKKIGDDCEMVYIYGEVPKALLPLYQIKINDVISGNIPFKENVRKLSSFTVFIH